MPVKYVFVTGGVVSGLGKELQLLHSDDFSKPEAIK